MARVKIGNVFPSDQYLLERCAPAGYGLGVYGMTAIDDCNNATKNGWYLINANAANSPFRDAHGAMRVDIHTTSHIVQTAYSGAFSGRGVAILQRVKLSGVWQEWEWVNPFMTEGDEYRTTERYMGNPVYIKLVDCDGMPSPNSTKEVEHGIQSISHIVDFGGEMIPSYANPISLPFRFSGDNYAYLSVDVHRVVLESGATDLAAYTNVHVWIKYTKTTD
jgi:hypothetical protein